MKKRFFAIAAALCLVAGTALYASSSNSNATSSSCSCTVCTCGPNCTC